MLATAEGVLTEEYRTRLDRIAREHYHTAENHYESRAEELRSELHDEPRPVGSGAGRHVLAVPDDAVADHVSEEYVAKIAVPCRDEALYGGRKQNQHEASVWQETYNEHLLPVTDHDDDGYWLVMPRGHTRFDAHSRQFHTWLDTATRSLDGIVWSADVRRVNAVKHDGEFRICDYGVPPIEEEDC